MREQLFKVLKRFGMPIVSCSNKEAILKTIVMGLFTNAAYLHPSGMYKTIRGDISLKVHFQIALLQAPFPLLQLSAPFLMLLSRCLAPSPSLFIPWL